MKKTTTNEVATAFCGEKLKIKINIGISINPPPMPTKVPNPPTKIPNVNNPMIEKIMIRLPKYFN